MSVVTIKNESPLQLLAPGSGAEAALVRADRAYATLKTTILSPEHAGETAAGIERLLQREGFEVLRLLFEGFLENRSLNRPAGPVIGEDGVERTHCRKDTERTLATMFGDVAVTRLAWTPRGADARHPTDGELNLPSVKYSLELQRQMSIAAARMPGESRRCPPAAGASRQRRLRRLLALSREAGALAQSRESVPGPSRTEDRKSTSNRAF